MQASWPTGGGAVVVEVDVELLVLVDVEGLLVVVLLVVVLVLLVVGAMVVVVVVVVDVVLVDVDTRVLVPAGGSVAREGEPVGESHPVATRNRVMTGSVTSLGN